MVLWTWHGIQNRHYAKLSRWTFKFIERTDKWINFGVARFRLTSTRQVTAVLLDLKLANKTYPISLNAYYITLNVRDGCLSIIRQWRMLQCNLHYK